MGSEQLRMSSASGGATCPTRSLSLSSLVSVPLILVYIDMSNTIVISVFSCQCSTHSRVQSPITASNLNHRVLPGVRLQTSQADNMRHISSFSTADSMRLCHMRLLHRRSTR